MRIYDGNNQARIWWERSTTGKPLRELQFEANTPGEARIFTWDGFKANDRRRALFPNYKRKKEEELAPDEFYVVVKQMKQMLKHTSAIQLEISGYEADDLIYSLLKHYKNPNGEPLLVISTDRDLRQISHWPRVILTSHPIENVKDEEVRLYKTWVGDSSDKIPGVDGFGKLSWQKADKEQLQLFIDDPEVPVDQIAMYLSKRSYRWLSIPSNRLMLQSMYECIGLIEIPEAELLDNLRVGRRDDAKADALMREYFQ